MCDAPLLLTDLDFFDQETDRYQEAIAETLMEKRSQAGVMNENPMEELSDVYAEIQIIEGDFKKALGMCKHLIGHSRSLFNKHREVSEELD